MRTISLSLIVSRLSGQGYTAFVRDNFATPLNMTSASYDRTMSAPTTA
jgi:CubicO group peptidase (beta-lactamase class C family)